MEGDFIVVGVGINIGRVRQTTFKTTTYGKVKINFLVGLKEIHMVKLVHGLKAHKILLRD